MERADVKQDLRKKGMPGDLGVESRHLQPFGYLHGGVSVVPAGAVATIGGRLNRQPRKGTVGVRLLTNESGKAGCVCRCTLPVTDLD